MKSDRKRINMLWQTVAQFAKHGRTGVYGEVGGGRPIGGRDRSRDVPARCDHVTNPLMPRDGGSLSKLNTEVSNHQFLALPVLILFMRFHRAFIAVILLPDFPDGGGVRAYACVSEGCVSFCGDTVIPRNLCKKCVLMCEEE